MSCRSIHCDTGIPRLPDVLGSTRYLFHCGRGPACGDHHSEKCTVSEVELVHAENSADADRRAVARVPDVLRQPGAAHEAHAHWEAAHQALTEAREAADLEAGQ
jgi:hypothetical protein